MGKKDEREENMDVGAGSGMFSFVGAQVPLLRNGTRNSGVGSLRAPRF